MPRLEEWAIMTVPAEPYSNPDNMKQVLTGKVYEQPGKNDGSKINTTAIITVSGREVVTADGTVYRLGTVSDNYVKWCDSNNIATREQLEGPTPVILRR